jgi:hypothetical protein
VVASAAGAACIGVTSQGNNLSDTTDCDFQAGKGDLVNATPKLGPLALNAPGTTKTHALLAGSPAIDAETFFSGVV